MAVFAIVVPIALRAQVNALADSLAEVTDGSSLTIPIRSIGSEAQTHCGCMPVISRPAALSQLNALKQTEPYVSSAIVAELDESDLAVSFRQLLTDHGLEMIPPPPK